MPASPPAVLLSQSNHVVMSEVLGDRFSPPTLPEHVCGVCGAPVGRWCLVLMGGTGWQHADRRKSSWEI